MLKKIFKFVAYALFITVVWLAVIILPKPEYERAAYRMPPTFYPTLVCAVFGSAECQYNLGHVFLDTDKQSYIPKYGTTGILNPRAANYWFERAAKQGHNEGIGWYASSLCQNMYFLKDYTLNPEEGLAWYIIYVKNDQNQLHPDPNSKDNEYWNIRKCRQNLELSDDEDGWQRAIEKAQKRTLEIQKTF